jgi:hypothetical protein
MSKNKRKERKSGKKLSDYSFSFEEGGGGFLLAFQVIRRRSSVALLALWELLHTHRHTREKKKDIKNDKKTQQQLDASVARCVPNAPLL